MHILAVVQCHSRRQTRSQPTQLVGLLPVKTEGVEQLVINRLDDLMDAGQPPPELLGPGFAGVALGRVDDVRPVAFQPAPMVLFALKALIGHVGSAEEGRAHARQPRVRLMAYSEEGLKATCWSVA